METRRVLQSADNTRVSILYDSDFIAITPIGMFVVQNSQMSLDDNFLIP